MKSAPDKPGWWWHYSEHGGKPELYRISKIKGELMVYFYIPEAGDQPFESFAITPFAGQWDGPIKPAS